MTLCTHMILWMRRRWRSAAAAAMLAGAGWGIVLGAEDLGALGRSTARMLAWAPEGRRS